VSTIDPPCDRVHIRLMGPSQPALSEVMAPRRVSGRVFNSPQQSENYWTRVRYADEGTPVGRLTVRLAGRTRAAS
jgi:hypothetical protein